MAYVFTSSPCSRVNVNPILHDVSTSGIYKITPWGPLKTRQMAICEDTPRVNARRIQSPGEGRYMVARRWSRVSGGTPGKRTNKLEPRLRGDIMRGLNMGQNTYNASIQCTTYRVGGFRPLSHHRTCELPHTAVSKLLVGLLQGI